MGAKIIGRRVACTDPELGARGGFVEALQEALRDGESGMRALPSRIVKVLDTKAWKLRYDPRIGRDVGFDTVEDFIAAPVPRGLETTVEMLRDLLSRDPAALDALDRALQRPPHRPEGSVNNVNASRRPQGNARAQALRSLRKNAPEIHARVLAGELKPHAGMIEAGLRKRTMTVPTDPAAAAAAIRRRFTAPELRAFLEALSEPC